MSKIGLAFEKARKENRPALLTYTVAGDSTKKKSLEILKSISKNIDICELGLPHNTPIGDGGEIQTSSYRAIKNGINMNNIFQLVKNYKKNKFSKPLILMGYYNMIYQFGENKFLEKCKKTGVNGLIVVDLPWPENKIFSKKCKKKSVSFIQLLSPTTSKIRLKEIVKDSHDMIYYISMLSTTGGKLKILPKKLLQKYNEIKRICKNKNLVIGFGITDKNIKKLRSADGLVVGSLLCKTISNSLKNGQNPVTMIRKIVNTLRGKIA